jgi:pimeloyl-ACP methyl ester carboxylesterase
LHCSIDTGEGMPVVLLHGIGASSESWNRLAVELGETSCRVLAFDLLGFGDSPKPDWPLYSVDDHARAIIAALDRKKLHSPAILVGHSMGSLIAVHIARLRPDLVRHLILYEAPFYVGLPNSRRYTKRRDLYFNIYNQIIESRDLALTTRQSMRKLVQRFSGFIISEDTWIPFTRSLQNTIISQTTLNDVKQLSVPIDVIYGKLDMLVIQGAPKKVFGAEAAHVTTHTITEMHVVSRRASVFLAGLIRDVLAVG